MHKKEASDLFKLLGDENRVKICKFLYNKGEMCACELLKIVDCKQATLSHHMNLLVKSNLVFARENGKWVHYTINKELLLELMNFFSSPCQCTK